MPTCHPSQKRDETHEAPAMMFNPKWIHCRSLRPPNLLRLFIASLPLAGCLHDSPAAPVKTSALPGVFPPASLRWELELGTHQYTVPRVDRGHLYVGINDARLSHPAVSSTGGGLLLCLDPETGAMLWQQIIPRYMAGTKAPFHFNHWKCGVCSRPAIDGKRLFIVGPRGDVLCLDRDGQADGNDGPFIEEKAYMGIPAGTPYELTRTEGDILWRYDLIRELGVVPHDVCGSSPLVQGDFVYACTSNGMDDTHRKVANPRAPSLVALDKRTGRLAGVDGEQIGQRLFHGQWSSPAAATFGGQPMILFGGGDGVLYAFAPLPASSGGSGVRTLERIWQHDCCPADYRQRDGVPIPYSRWNQKSPDGPSEIIGTPVVDRNRIYVTIGQSPVHGPGRGQLSCIDGASGQTLWESRQIDRSLSDVALHQGLLYVADYSGRLHCLEAETGTILWQQDLGGGVWTCSPVVAHDRVYIATEKQMLWVLKAGRAKEVLARCRLQSVGITPVVHNNLFYFPTQRRLLAFRYDD